MTTGDQFSEMLGLLQADMEDLDYGPALRECAEILREDIEKNFALQRGPDDQQWLPRKDKLTHPLLDLTGRLYRAATKEYAEGSITEVTDDSLLIGVDGDVVEYAIFHMLGTRRMPARPFYGASEVALDKCEQTIAEYLNQHLHRLFDRSSAPEGQVA